MALVPQRGVTVRPEALEAGSRRAQRILGSFDDVVLERLASLPITGGGYANDTNVYRCLYNLALLSALQAAFPETNGIPLAPLELNSFFLCVERVAVHDHAYP